ncbi:HNH endonuclease [Sabulibacter ruber]|uniref:HNH endonuclease n=1 Tax=Sabulibacter ruber TaxID=2811901 RepID=UPI001A95F61F|nr:HNH endonuclease [Sabulibacter ruber]
MSRTFEKRRKIFQSYVSQLKLMQDHSLLPNNLHYKEDSYLCPICLRPFTEEDLSDSSPNMLTLEDAPPKSLGGKANTLTCKECNSKCGHDIDFHLTERLLEIDVQSFLPGTTALAKINNNGTEVQGEISVNKDREITIIHRNKNNNPEKLKSFISSTRKGVQVTVNFKPSRVEIHRLEVALLKSAYILAFEQFGYALILDEAFDIVRMQILNPENQIYPQGFWTKQTSFEKEHEGVHAINNIGLVGFYAVFTLRTATSENRYGVYLPIAANKTKNVINQLKLKDAGFSFSLTNVKMNDYFKEKENIRLLRQYIDKRK